jgi:hypothetical protein
MMRRLPSPSHRCAMGPSLSRFAGEGLSAEPSPGTEEGGEGVSPSRVRVYCR